MGCHLVSRWLLVLIFKKILFTLPWCTCLPHLKCLVRKTERCKNRKNSKGSLSRDQAMNANFFENSFWSRPIPKHLLLFGVSTTIHLWEKHAHLFCVRGWPSWIKMALYADFAKISWTIPDCIWKGINHNVASQVKTCLDMFLNVKKKSKKNGINIKRKIFSGVGLSYVPMYQIWSI